MDEETSKIDMKTILELDQIVSHRFLSYLLNNLSFVEVSDQQMTLERAGVPGFHVTNNPTEIRVQMYILEFIARLSSDT